MVQGGAKNLLRWDDIVVALFSTACSG